MLVHFEASPKELATYPSAELEELFSELLRASLRGYHLVLVDRICADWALENILLNSRERAHLSALRNAFTQRGALREVAKFKLSIGLGTFGLQQVGSAFQIGHVPLLRGEYLERAVLLVENAQNDGEFVRQIFHALNRTHTVKEFSIDIQNGGGSAIVPSYDAALRAKRIVVCLVDSDKVAPLAGQSATVKALKRTAGLQTFVGELYVTTCREIENVLPPSLIFEHGVCPQYPDVTALSHLIQNQGAARREDSIWLYFDAKKGFSGSSLLASSHPSSVRQWLVDNFGQGTDITTLNLAGFGEGLLQQFLRSGHAMHAFARHVCTDEWRYLFGDFFDDMLWFFAAERKRAGI